MAEMSTAVAGSTRMTLSMWCPVHLTEDTRRESSIRHKHRRKLSNERVHS